MPTNKQRREAARRHLERQLERRAEREAARKRFVMIASVVGTIVVIAAVIVFIVAVGNDGKKPSPQAGGTGAPAGQQTTAPATPSQTTKAAPTAKGDCTFTPDGQAAKTATPPPNGKVPTTGTLTVDVTTNQGPLTVQLNRAAAPCTVDSFVSLVKQHYFDDTRCHRLTTEGIYVLQCGDPTGTGSGGPGYRFNDELSGSEKYSRGVLAMANSGPNTNGSQFFIVYKDTQLPPSYTIFGKVTDGLPVIDKIAAAGTTSGGGDGAPKLPTQITSMTVAG